MQKITKKIEIVRSTDRLLSSMSDGPSNLILEAIQTKYSDVRITKASTIEDLNALVARNPDLCFLGLKQLPVSATDENMVWVSDYLDAHNINYTGSASSAIALEYNKQHAKEKVLEFGLRTSEYFIGHSVADFQNSNLEFPLFIKPSNLGNKAGVDSNSVVHTIEGYKDKTASLKADHDSEVLVESYLPGREFSVGVIEVSGSDKLLAFPIEAIVPKNDKGDRILGTNDAAEEEQVIKVSDLAIYDDVCTLAKGVFRAVGARDYGRIDMKLDKQGRANFLEANLIPGLQSSNYFPTANKLYRDKSYTDTILEIVDLALNRE